MSDRTAIVPERALLDTINDLRRRVEAMERRQRWHGAVQAFIQSGIDTWEWRDSLCTGLIENDVAEMDLDPGRWMLTWTGVFSETMTAGSAPIYLDYYMEITYAGNPTPEVIASNSQVLLAASAGGPYTPYATTVLVGSVSANVAMHVRIYLTGDRDSACASGNGNYQGSALVAVPC